jgi:hypothetical protein
MISRLLLPSAVRLELRSPWYDDLCASEPDREHVQRTVGVSVATTVETMPHHLAGGSFDGRDSAETREGGLTSQPLGVVFKATISSVAAWSVPMPLKETNSGATCPTN